MPAASVSATWRVAGLSGRASAHERASLTGGLRRGLSHPGRDLVREKRYTCIKWLCIANEPPGGTWRY